MNNRVKKTIFTMPFIVDFMSPADSVGDSTLIKSVTFNGYIQEKIAVVINANGEEETSGVQVYATGADIVTIDTSSLVSCLTYKSRKIIKRDCYYKPGGIPDVGVLYLP